MTSYDSLGWVLAKKLVDHSDQMLFAVDAATLKIVEFNEKACSMLGYPHDAMIGMSIEQIESGLVGMFYWQDAACGNIQKLENTESEFQRSDGSILMVEKSVSICAVNERNYVLISAIDITGRLHTESEFANMSVRLKSTLESTADGILATSGMGKIEGMNQRFSQMWDIPVEIFSSGDDQQFIEHLLLSAVDSELLRKFLSYADEDEQAITVTLHSGKILDLKSCPQQATQGRVFSCNDVTLRVLAEREAGLSKAEAQKMTRELTRNQKILQLENEKNLALLHNASDGIHILDTDGNVIEVSDSFCDMLGYRREEVIGMNVSQWDAVLSDSELKVVLRQQFAQHKRSQFESRHRRRDGSIFDVEISEFPLLLDGKPVLFNSSRDITERKQAELLIRMQADALYSSTNGVAIADAADPELPLVYVNPAFEEITGYPASELLGRNCRFLQGQDRDQPGLAEIRSCLKEGRAGKAILRNYKKDGTLFWNSINISPLLDKEGKVTQFLAIINDITESKQAEAEILRFKNILDNTLDMVFMFESESLDFIYLNHGAVLSMGYSREELLGMKPCQIKPLLPESQFRQLIAPLLSGEQTSLRFETVHRRKDGTDFPVDVVLQLMMNSNGKRFFVAIMRDITERKQAQDQQSKIAKELADFKAALDQHAIVATTDPRGIITYANDNFCAISKYAREELIGQNHRIINSGHHPQAFFNELWQTLHSGRVWKGEIKNRAKDGTFYWVVTTIVPFLDEHGKPIQYIAIRTDITERKRVEKAVIYAREQAEQANRTKGMFIANMSHEIRTPMNAIIGLSQLALNKQMPDDVRDYLEKINVASESLLRILNDILDFSKIEAGKLGIENTPFSLGYLLGNLYNLFSAPAEQKRIGYEIDVADNMPDQFIGDALRIGQILANLIGNAIKFTQQGGVRLELQLLELNKGLAVVRFCVKDNGIGMSDEEQAMLFLPFSQADSSITRRFGGTGLGLAISHKLLELMGGNFQVKSAKGQGSAFCFEITLTVASSELYKDIAHATGRHHAGSLGEIMRERGLALSGAQVLVVEDNRINQQVVKELLQLSGIVVSTANNGREALQMLDQHNYDAVLMDVHMPEMDGLEATECIRRQSKFDNLPIIALSAGVTQEERGKCFSVGMNDFAVKPVKPDEIIDVLCRWVKGRVQKTPLAELEIESLSGLSGLNDLPGFDVTQILEIFDGNEEVVVNLMQGFRDDLERFTTEIGDYIACQEYQDAHRLTHEIKGTAGSLGAVVLYDAATALDNILRQGKMDQSAYERFQEVMLNTRDVLMKLKSPTITT